MQKILYLERSEIRDNFSLPILVGICEIILKGFESDFAVFIQYLPETDPETLDPDNRNCPICWSDFKLPSKYDPFETGHRTDWKVVELTGRLYEYMEGHGRSWKVMESHGKSWKIMKTGRMSGLCDHL